MDHKYWIILDWAGTPMPSNPSHAGWSEIETFQLDPFTRTARKGGGFSVTIPFNSPSMVLAPPLMKKVSEGGSYASIAVDLMVPEGTWLRHEFRNIEVTASVPYQASFGFAFMFEKVQTKQITLRSQR